MTVKQEVEVLNCVIEVSLFRRLVKNDNHVCDELLSFCCLTGSLPDAINRVSTFHNTPEASLTNTRVLTV